MDEKKLAALIREIIREETPKIIRTETLKIIREETPQIIRAELKKELDPIKKNINELNQKGC